MGKESVPSEKEMQGLLRILNEGLGALKPEELSTVSACPDSSIFALFVQGEVDEKTREEINAHMPCRKRRRLVSYSYSKSRSSL